MDAFISDVGGDLRGYNMFVYCFNNPVMYTDHTGHWPEWFKNFAKWRIENIVEPIVESIENALSHVDFTYSQGINISGTPSAFIFNAQAGISFDSKGNIAIQGSLGGGITTGTPSISLTTYTNITNAPNINKLNGLGYQMGGSMAVLLFGVPVAAGFDLNFIPDIDTAYIGVTNTAGLGTPGGEVHAEWGKTATWNFSKINIFDVLEMVFIKIREW